MDKEQAIQSFWEGFGLTAYDENTVPEGAKMPYITYNVSTGNMGTVLLLQASLWYYSTSWEAISKKTEEIARTIGSGYAIKKVDGGYLWLTQGTPFSQRMADENYMIRRVYINLNAEFLTAY